MRRYFIFCLSLLVFVALSACGLRDLTSEGDTSGMSAPGTLPPPAIRTLESQATTGVQQTFLNEVDIQADLFVNGIYIKDTGNPSLLGLFSAEDRLWTRFDRFHWDKIEPVLSDPPAYDWSKVPDNQIIQLNSLGYQVIGTVRYAPDWAQKYPSIFCGPVAEEDLDRYAEFLFQLVSHYSQPPFNIHHWEMGNEPDISWELVRPRSAFGCWGESGDAYYGGGYYAEMLKKAYPRIKAADPDSVVWIGGLLLDCNPDNPPEDPPGSGVPKDCTPAKFLEGILANGGRDFFDGVSYHSYDYYQNERGKYANPNWHASWETSGPVLNTKTRFIKDLLESYGVKDKLLANTEVALICGRTGNEPECLTEDYLFTKAVYLVQANTAAMAAGIQINIWFSLEGWRGSGLLDEQLQPNSAMTAYKFNINQLNGAGYVRSFSPASGVTTHEFMVDGARQWVLWSADGQTHEVSLPETPAKIFDMYGRELPVSQQTVVDYSPIYVIWEP